MKDTQITSFVFSSDPWKMQWFRPDYSYAEVRCPDDFVAKTSHRREGDELFTRIEITYQGKHPYLTNIGSIAISFPLQDRYEDSITCRDTRCHTHIFCGETTSYILALRMGGMAPHLGMVLTKGSLSGYSIERDLSKQSNDRGCFWLHPSAQEFVCGDTLVLEWKVFPHNGREDFRNKLRTEPSVILVEAEHYVVYPGEENWIQIDPPQGTKMVTVNGEPIEKDETGCYRYCFEEKCLGESMLTIQADEQKTHCRLLVQERPEVLAQRRCDFIMEHQQYHGAIKELQGAYLAYDNEEKQMVCTSEYDFNAGRERIGMGILMARAIQKQLVSDPKKALESLEEYREFLLRELVEEESGRVCNTTGKDDSFFRLYNYPWAVTFFIECYKIWKKKEDLLLACRIVLKYYEQGGSRFYPIEMPIVSLCKTLEEAGESAWFVKMKECFCHHADQIIEIGTAYPPHEVNYEQTIVEPAADIILQVYELTKDTKYLEGAERQLAVLELFHGQQPDYHLHEVAIRHWDGYWFGKRRIYGDTFPHYWSVEDGRTFYRYARLTKDPVYTKRAQHALRGVLSMFFPDGSATCAYLFPYSVNGYKTDFADPYANDQDWGLCANLEEQ